jgi:hypothetical protein
MTFSYDATLATNRDYLRSLLGDTEPDAGPYPERGNFTNELLDRFLTNGGSVNRAYILAARLMATVWSNYAKRVTGTSMSVDATQVAEEWRRNAKDAATTPVDGSAPPPRWRVFNGTVNG